MQRVHNLGTKIGGLIEVLVQLGCPISDRPIPGFDTETCTVCRSCLDHLSK